MRGKVRAHDPSFSRRPWLDALICLQPKSADQVLVGELAARFVGYGVGCGSAWQGPGLLLSPSPPPSAGLPGRCDPAARLFVVWEQPVCHHFFLDAGSAPTRQSLLVIAVGIRLLCTSAGFLAFSFFFGVRASFQG